MELNIYVSLHVFKPALVQGNPCAELGTVDSCVAGGSTGELSWGRTASLPSSSVSTGSGQVSSCWVHEITHHGKTLSIEAETDSSLRVWFMVE